MTEKQFRVQEHCLRSSYGIEAENWLVTNDNHSAVLNDKAEAHMVANMCNDVIDVLNEQHEENEQLKNKIKSLTIELSTHKHPLWSTREAERVVNKFKKENEELKTENHYLKNKLKRLGIIIDDVIL